MPEKHEPSMTPLKILTLDGGGVQAISTLLILNRVLENIAIQNGTPNNKPRPCDIFDTIAGIGTGGWLAILLGRFRMDVTSCLSEWYSLIRCITPKSISEQLRLRFFQHSYFDKDRLLNQVDHLTSLYNTGDLLYENDPESAHTRHVIVAALKSDATSYNLFRTYEIPKSAQKPEEMLEGPQYPSHFKISDAFSANSGARYFTSHSNPQNITKLALDEMWGIYGKAVPLAVVLNIGPSSPQGVEVNHIARRSSLGSNPPPGNIHGPVKGGKPFAKLNLWSKDSDINAKTALEPDLEKRSLQSIHRRNSVPEPPAEDDRSQDIIPTNSPEFIKGRAKHAKEGRPEADMTSDVRSKLENTHVYGSDPYFRLAPEQALKGTPQNDLIDPGVGLDAAQQFLSDPLMKIRIDEIVKRITQKTSSTCIGYKFHTNVINLLKYLHCDAQSHSQPPENAIEEIAIVQIAFSLLTRAWLLVAITRIYRLRLATLKFTANLHCLLLSAICKLRKDAYKWDEWVNIIILDDAAPGFFLTRVESMKNLAGCAFALTLLFIISISNGQATGDNGPKTLNNLPSSVNSTNFDSLPDLFLNSTLDSDIPSDFKIDPLCTKPSLLPVSLLLNAVYTQSQLALGDYEGQFPRASSFVLTSHPQTEMVILPYGDEGSLTMPWKYAVWAVNMSAKWLIKNKKYQTCTFFIFRGGVGIGAVQYKRSYKIGLGTGSVDGLNGTELHLTQENALNIELSSTENITALSSSDNPASNINTTNPPPPILTPPLTTNATLPTYTFNLTGTHLSFQRIVLTSLDVLLTISDHNRIDRELRGTSYIASSKLYVSARDPNNPPRTEDNPPYFQAEWLMYAMASLPGVMVQRQSFREAVVGIQVDGVEVGVVGVGVKRPVGGAGVDTE